LVRRKKIRQADDPDRTRGLVFAHPVNRTSTNGVTGSPSRATTAQGRRLFRWMVADLATLVRRGRREKPPLPAGYDQRVSSL
jgi:creatinine amidohydrolase